LQHVSATNSSEIGRSATSRLDRHDNGPIPARRLARYPFRNTRPRRGGPHLELSIEAASDDTGIALSVGGVAALIATWPTERNHSIELLPNIDRMLSEAGRSKRDIEAVFVDIGPGGYAGLRVGVSIAKALAHGLGVPVVGAGRLELDAQGVAPEAARRRIVAVHAAGRGEVAWAVYRDADCWREESPPHIERREAFLAAIRADDAVTGDIDAGLAEAIQRAGAVALSARRHRVVALAELGHARRAAGRIDDAASLAPLYLRAPAIGPQGGGR
jgi:tRNA threonylcarbamoyl adenosine modification protein YeaZ